jgi:hypothetical protein
MPKPSAKKTVKSDAQVSTEEDAATTDLEALKKTQIAPVDQRFLDRVMRFLVAIQSPLYVLRARREGYTTAEHREGWRLWRASAGADRPLDHWLAEHEAQSPLASAEQLRLLQEIDTFENKWFPRTRGIIRHVVPRDARDGFAAAFFKNLEQQPLGPGVVGSVTTYLARIDDLSKSASPHAKAVRATLESRGLTPAKLEDIQKLLDKAAHRAGDVPPPKPDAAAIKKAQAAQIDALADLRDWFSDWGTTLRSVLNVQEQIKLGLTQVKRSGAVVDAEDVVGDEEVDTNPDDDDTADPNVGVTKGADAKGKVR